MDIDQLMKFGAYEKSRRLFELVADDMESLTRNPLCTRMVSQQMASADSICANIEEGYGRESSREYRHYLIIARGSARETQGRYLRFGRWLTAERIAPKVELCEEIIRIVSATIRRLDNR
ncbi:MAG TPA: four helix bundle protein [Opitutaceae bacterium]|nr:four helix bundle protein [Opitutaceae bacterium]